MIGLTIWSHDSIPNYNWKIKIEEKKRNQLRKLSKKNSDIDTAIFLKLIAGVNRMQNFLTTCFLKHVFIYLIQMSDLQCISMCTTCRQGPFWHPRIALGVVELKFKITVDYSMSAGSWGIDTVNYGAVSAATESKRSSLAIILIVLFFNLSHQFVFHMVIPHETLLLVVLSRWNLQMDNQVNFDGISPPCFPST